MVAEAKILVLMTISVVVVVVLVLLENLAILRQALVERALKVLLTEHPLIGLVEVVEPDKFLAVVTRSQPEVTVVVVVALPELTEQQIREVAELEVLVSLLAMKPLGRVAQAS